MIKLKNLLINPELVEWIDERHNYDNEVYLHINYISGHYTNVLGCTLSDYENAWREVKNSGAK